MENHLKTKGKELKLTTLGFTLIELLAVIVILAIIALIATPIVLNIINDARKSAAVDSAYGYIEAIDYNNSMAQLNNKYNKIESGNVIDINGVVNVKGTKPTSGIVIVDASGRVIEATLMINGYEVKYDGEKAIVERKDNSEIEEQVTGPTKVLPAGAETYKAIVYLDPTDLTKTCDATNSVSTTGTKIGCMKWYVYKDDGTKYTMILDHNTTSLVQWNSSGNNADGMKEVQDELDKLTTSDIGWKVTSRLISADEVAKITGAKDSLKWDSSKIHGTDDIETKVSWFYFDGTGTTYSEADGWKKSVASTQGASKYAWLFDNTYECTSYGCNISDDNKYEYGTAGNTNNIYGYWTSTPMVDYSSYAWLVFKNGCLSNNYVADDHNYGLRPVITIEKSLIK